MKWLLLTPLIALFLTSAVYGQNRKSLHYDDETMTLTGTVYDVNGAVIVSGVRVVAYSLEGNEYAAPTNNEGIYTIHLPFSTYKVEAWAPGFCRTQIERFTVVNSTNGKMSLDFVLNVAGAEQPGCGRHETQFRKKSRRGHRKTLKNTAE